MADVLGIGGRYWDPLWRVGVDLSPLEQELLRCAPVRRLAFVAFAGASSIAGTQSGSRLEHSLGVFALVAHLAPDDPLARAAALLHDVGHLPLSHTLEGLWGLDHHALGATRIRELGDLLARHGVTAGDIVDVLDGTRPSVLTPAPGVLKHDHLDGLVRSARFHGRSRRPPPALLARIALVGGGVSTDATTASELADMVVEEALLHTAPMNVVVDAAVRHLVVEWLDAAGGGPDDLARLTDDELWAALLAHPATAAATRQLRRDPTSWRIAGAHDDRPGQVVTVRRLYLNLPVVDGRPMSPPTAFADLPEVPATFAVLPPDTPATVSPLRPSPASSNP